MLQISAHLSAHLYTYGRACPRVHVYTHNSVTIFVGIYDDRLAAVRHTEGIDIIRQPVAVVIFRALHAIEQAIVIAIEIEVVRDTIFVCIIGTSASKRCPDLPATALYPVWYLVVIAV